MHIYTYNCVFVFIIDASGWSMALCTSSALVFIKGIICILSLHALHLSVDTYLHIYTYNCVCIFIIDAFGWGLSICTSSALAFTKGT
jgi:hypothetical protein